jgi:hypothetical protein
MKRIEVYVKPYARGIGAIVWSPGMYSDAVLSRFVPRMLDVKTEGEGSAVVGARLLGRKIRGRVNLVRIWAEAGITGVCPEDLELPGAQGEMFVFHFHRPEDDLEHRKDVLDLWERVKGAL